MTDPWQTVLDALRARFAPDADPDELSAFLSSEGYDRRQIGEIVARFRGDGDGGPAAGAAAGAAPGRGTRGRRGGRMAEAGDGLVAAPPPPVRLLGPHEWGRFEPEAWGRLLAWQASGLLTLPELEQVIDRVLSHTEGCVGLAELQAILDGIGLGDVGGDRDPVTIQ